MVATVSGRYVPVEAKEEKLHATCKQILEN